ncbi:MAG: sugar ABC transporter permease [Bacilli bacterium]|jgi:multiple sugar transport system permease protein|nr:sugar ABC transporter permease [Bacilli bacterium]
MTALAKSKIKKNIKKYGTVGLLLSPYLLAFIIFFIVPFFYGIFISFFKWDYFDPGSRVFLGFGTNSNYWTLLFSGSQRSLDFLNSIKNTLLFVVISVPLLIIIPLFIAILLDNEPKFYKVFRAIFFLPTVLSVTVVCLIFRWQFDSNNGFVNGILNLFGLDSVSWLNQQPFSWIAILVTTIWWTIGTNVVIFSAGLKDVDKQLYDAASIDGCGYFDSIIHVALPGIRNQLFLALFTSVISSFNLYGQSALLTEGGPEKSTTSATMWIYNLVFDTTKGGLAASAAIIFGFLILLVSVAQFIYQRKAEK